MCEAQNGLVTSDKMHAQPRKESNDMMTGFFTNETEKG